MKTIAESANDFRGLRTKKVPCIYVDKTAHFHRLITDPGRTLFFIARLAPVRETREAGGASKER